LAAPHTEEDRALSEENEEDTQMNEAPNKNVPECITPSESPNSDTSFLSSERLLGKRRRLTALNPDDTSFMNYMKLQTLSKTRDPVAKFLHSLLRDMKSITTEPKRTFKMEVLNLINELLDET
jgi:hypothetical protein